ncbi:MAG: hypothetical protein E4H36_04160 [Spirochaetales bacterium]|nr:MAG: hypothetical protein E4H36_04160 [Spirochaetales bacterium]
MQYFQDLAGRADQSWAKNEFKFLSEEEKKRSIYIQKRIEELKKQGKGSGTMGACDPEKKLYRFVEKEILGPFIKAKSDEALKNGTSALALGRDVQKKTVQFYNELVTHEKGTSQEKDLTEILAGEQEYLRRLNYILSY